MNIPLPPGVKLEPLPMPTEFEIPNKPDVVSDKAKSFILDKVLHPDHRHSPTVLRFIDAYLHTFDVAEASRMADIKPSQGKNLKNRPDIAEAIKQLTDLAVDKFGFNANEVVERVKNVLNFDPACVMNEDGTYKKRIDEIPFEYRTAIVKMKVRNEFGVDSNGLRTVTGEIIEIEFERKLKAAEMLGPEKGVFKKEIDINVHKQISISSAMADAEKRVQLAARDVTPGTDVTNE